MKTDLDKMQGTWNVITLEVEGQKYPPGGSQIVIRGGRFVSMNMGEEYEGTVVLDESAEPKRLDMTFDKGPHAGEKSLGIYELTGDNWKICVGMAGIKKRPEQFVAPPGTGHAVETLKRDSGLKRDLPKADAHAAPSVDLEGAWQMLSCQQDGKPMDAGFVKSARREFRGNTTTLMVGGKPMMKSRFFADGARKTIEYPDLRQEGIYEVSGDTLRTSLVMVGEARPADFSSKSGDGRTVSSWKRS